MNILNWKEFVTCVMQKYLAIFELLSDAQEWIVSVFSNANFFKPQFFTQNWLIKWSDKTALVYIVHWCFKNETFAFGSPCTTSRDENVIKK